MFRCWAVLPQVRCHDLLDMRWRGRGRVHDDWLRRRAMTMAARRSESTPRQSARPAPLAGDITDVPGASDELTLLPVQRQTLTSMTVDAIRERILRGRYPE